MEKIPISAVWPLQDGVLQIIFETGSTAVVNFQTKFQTARFGPLREEAVWKSAKTDQPGLAPCGRRQSGRVRRRTENSSAGTGTVSRWWRWPATSCWA